MEGVEGEVVVGKDEVGEGYEEIRGITFRLRAQPWVPGWPPPKLISSWDPWRRTS